MKKNVIFRLLTSAILLIPLSLQAQVTIGLDIPATQGSLLDLKAKQTAATVSSVSDDGNITAGLGDGFLLLARVNLVDITTLEPFIAANDPEFVNNTNSLKEKLAGLMVYNITDNGVGSLLTPGVYSWNGAVWATSKLDEGISLITEQPKAFKFYELGTELPEALTITVSGPGTWTYQWYQVTGSNVHVRIGKKIGESGTISGTGATTDSFVPTGVIKGATINAKNAGFYKFYCIVENDAGVILESDIAEVAVGCGAKNSAGEWLSFMCFNLGAQNGITMQEQKDFAITPYTNGDNGIYPYIPGTETVWGDFFQWGRIPDGHEKRNSVAVSFTGLTSGQITSGLRCFVTDVEHPYSQIMKSSAWYGKFIMGTSASNYNWSPSSQDVADVLWRNGRYIGNDPCARYKEDGSYQEFWHEGTQDTADSPACTDAGTAWRTPTIDEWGSIYKGSGMSGTPDGAIANTWAWHGGTSNTISNIRGYEIKPDGATITLFLPAGGARTAGADEIVYQGNVGSYWSTSYMNTNAYYMRTAIGSVNPITTQYRAYGLSLRCIKNS